LTAGLRSSARSKVQPALDVDLGWALEAFFGDSKIKNGQVTLWQVVAAYVFALAGGSISTSLHLAHKPFCALISFAAGTLLNPIFNM
jgi:hypothetical protein